jgi:hypothetical protein
VSAAGAAQPQGAPPDRSGLSVALAPGSLSTYLLLDGISVARHATSTGALRRSVREQGILPEEAS